MTCSIPAQQSYYKLQGFVYDLNESVSLPGTSVILPENQTGVVTDENGFFVLKVKKSPVIIQFSYIGYETKTLEIHLQNDTLVNVWLKPHTITTDEVIISGNNNQLSETEIGKIKLLEKDIKLLPSVGGERDLLKIMMLTPGIQSLSEGSSGLYVRGGNAGENLILLDEMPLYNPNHLLGFFPVFNASVIQSIEISKGIDDAESGGRLSSVVKVKMKEGSSKRVEGEINTGFLSSSFTLTGPVKNKTRFLFSARKTYLGLVQDLILKKLMPHDNFISNTRYSFQDFYAKINQTITTNDKLQFTFYGGFDDYLLKHKSLDFGNKMNWFNLAGSASWLHSFNENLYNQLSFGYTSYKHDMNAAFSSYNFGLGSYIQDFYMKNVLTYSGFENHLLKAGLEYIAHNNKPGEVNARALTIDFKQGEQYYSNELALFINDEYQLSDNLTINAGLRYNRYTHVGPFNALIINGLNQVIDTIHYNKNETIYNSDSWEPRIIIRYNISSVQFVKGGVARISQPIHLIPVGGVSLPADIWFSSSLFAPPAVSWQYSAGYGRQLGIKNLEVSLEGYYKLMEGIIEKNKSILNNFDEGSPGNSFAIGNGLAYGLEFFLKKSSGMFNGWISYTLSKSTRKFDDLNNGRSFVSKYDRPHDLSVVLNYKLNESWSVSGIFVYATGNALTLPVGRYSIQGIIMNDYTKVNEYRLPDYHRLDIAINRISKKSWGEIIWNFSVYNVYNRSNPYYIFFEAEADLDSYYLRVEPEKITLYPILPSLSLIVKF